MSKLTDLFASVSEAGLTKTQLEDYHTQLSALFAQMHVEAAMLEKTEALYFLGSELPSDVAKKRSWNGTEHGLRLIEIKHYIRGTEKLLSSLKNRLYNQY